MERISGVESAVGSGVGGQQIGVSTPHATGVPEGLGSSNPFTLFMRSTPLSGSVYVPPAAGSIRGSFRRSVARERRRIQVFLEQKKLFSKYEPVSLFRSSLLSIVYQYWRLVLEGTVRDPELSCRRKVLRLQRLLW